MVVFETLDCHIDREQFFQLADSNYGLRGHSLKIHGFGTSCLLHCGRLTVSANSEDS